MTKRTVKTDIVFVLDATKSTQPVFNSMVDQVNDLAIDLKINFRKADFKYGAVVYRDPVDYKEARGLPVDAESQKIVDQIKALEKKERDEKLIANGLDPKEVDAQIEERRSHYDHEMFPFNKNIAIDFENDIENLIVDLMKVECGSGNDDPEDWVGALDLALHSLNWRENSKRAIVWIADANAHGKPYCGYDNHNDEAPKMDPLLQEMADMGIRFIGINVVRTSDRGCELTLQKMREKFLDYGGKSFRVEEFEVPKDGYVDDEIWPDNAMKDLMDTISRSLRSMGSIFDDTAV